MTKYFIIAASKDHVEKGVEGGFAQSGHGKRNNIAKLSKGDWIIYYSSKDKLENGKPCQKFTAIGKINDAEPYQPNSNSGFKPYRRNADYIKCNDADIRPLLDKLSFIKNKKRWGFYLLSGFIEIDAHDFELIKHAMK